MIKLIIVFLFFIVFLFISPFVVSNPGYVYISIYNYELQTSLIFLFLSTVCTLLLFYIAFVILRKIINVKNVFKNDVENALKSNLNTLFYHYILGDYDKSLYYSKKLSKKVPSYFSKVLLYKIDSFVNTNSNISNYFSEEELKQKKELEIIQVETLLNNQNYEKALEKLLELEKNLKLKKVYEYIFECCQKTNNNKVIFEYRDVLRKYNILKEENFEQCIINPIISKIEKINDLYVLRNMKDRLPKDICKNIKVQIVFSRQFCMNGDTKLCEKILNPILPIIKNNRQYLQLFVHWNSFNEKIVGFFEKIHNEECMEGMEEKVLFLKILSNMYFYSNNTKKAISLLEELNSIEHDESNYFRLCYLYQKEGNKEELSNILRTAYVKNIM